jgi:hypothetical protein
MFDRLKTQWRQLEESRPGHRFRDRYERHQRDRNAPKLLWRIVRIGAAVALVLIGGVFMFIPGPAILFYALAGALLATDSLPVAKLLDWSEVKIRQLWRWARQRWERLSTAGKVIVSTFSLALSAGATFLAFRLMAR